jgi:2-methylisocitrate lyase-like PEP mutase family enzyme
VAKLQRGVVTPCCTTTATTGVNPHRRETGLATYANMLDRAPTIAQAVDKPLIADGYTGYGGLLNAHHTVRGREQAGVAIILLEDQ